MIDDLKRWTRRLKAGIISDERFLRAKYRQVFGRELDLDNPRAFTEKIQWLKLHYRPAILTQCADKVEVRRFVGERAGAQLLKKLHAVYDRVDDIEPARLPDQFALKVNHGCKQNIYCTDRSRFDWDESRRLLRRYMKKNTYYSSREWAYKDIAPRILCEEHLTPNGEELYEHSFYCFNGKPRFVEVTRRWGGKNWANMYDLDLNLTERKYRDAQPLPEPPRRTPQFEAMLEAAGRLCPDFPFVRVDLFRVGDRHCFGELTFYPLGGLFLANQPDFDHYLGSCLQLPEPDASGERTLA